jgi:hypothetical protein
MKKAIHWRRHWKKKVAPHLQEELVQTSLDPLEALIPAAGFVALIPAAGFVALAAARAAAGKTGRDRTE